MGLNDLPSRGQKQSPRFRPGSFAFLFILISLISNLPTSAQQTAAPRSRITASINGKKRVVLAGHIHPRARTAEDDGVVSPDLVIPSVTLVLKPSEEQQTDLERFLTAQQDPASKEYHHWLTPEEYGLRFGIAESDLAKIRSWVESQGFVVSSVARGRNAIVFSGSASQVSAAFGTEIHNFKANGLVHFANATTPSLPAALGEVVTAVHGLNNFRFKHPHRILARPPVGDAATSSSSERVTLQPNYTSSSGTHYLAPDDFATIYNVKTLHAAGIDGSGQKIAIVGQTEINLSDIQQFRTYFSLPAKDPQLVLIPSSTSPGIVKGDIDEANLDIEWSGAVARNATIVYVYARDVTDAVQYAIDENLAPVLSMSYGLCEPLTPQSDAITLQTWARQANAQGITWFAASGDAGATDCAGGTTTSNSGLSVDIPASIPEVTGVGGTTFNEGTGSYWNKTGDANRASALSYIPEMVWNDSVLNSPSSGGGGSSSFFSKPSWQTGAGVPTDSARNVPDVAMAGSAQHDGYLFWSEGALGVVGGTSAGAPTFAGIAVLLNHYLISQGAQQNAGLGNINANLYRIAQTTPAAFHDVSTGSNIINVTCGARARNCTPGSYGYTAAPGYDQASGLGSVDAYALVTSWNSKGTAVTKANSTMTLSSTATDISYGQTALVTVTVTGSNGSTPTGSVTFSTTGFALGTAIISGSNGAARATFSIDGLQLAAGANLVVAQYGGDAGFNASTASLNVNLVPQVTLPPTISSLANGASFKTGFVPGGILTIFGSRLAPVAVIASNVPLTNQLAGATATINGITAPLYYVSPTQLNVQIPYETPANSTATLTVTYNQQSATTTFEVMASSAAIFTDGNGVVVPSSAAVRGQVMTIYLTGAGMVSPQIGTGAAPASGTDVANLPRPTQAVVVRVGGVPATIQFAGIPTGLVGVVQINFVVPATAPVGTQAIAVSIGGVFGPDATVRVQ